MVVNVGDTAAMSALSYTRWQVAFNAECLPWIVTATLRWRNRVIGGDAAWRYNEEWQATVIARENNGVLTVNVDGWRR